MIEEYPYDDEEEFDDEVEYYAVRPNKTKIKKDITALFNMGIEMSALSQSNLRQLGLPEELHEAISQVGGMGQNSARKRLLKFIAARMHKLDAEILEVITEKLARIKNKSAHAVREHHIAERWRDRLIAEDNDALTDFLYEYPEADRQHLRQLLRNIQKESQNGNPPKSARLLYRYLKELLNQEEDDEETLLDDGQDVGEDEDE
ncbi:ribosome biogenesis factor YjgA [Methylosoma difficile]